jgi:hypothetical protein
MGLHARRTPGAVGQFRLLIARAWKQAAPYRERERNAFACMERHQAFALAPVAPYRRCTECLFCWHLKLSVGGTGPSDLLEIEGLLTQGLRPGRTDGQPVGGIFKTDSSDWSNGIRYHIFDTIPNTKFKPSVPETT